MPKKGQRQPWRVSFQWDSGVKGAETFSDAEDAEARADKIRRAAESQGREVTVTVENRDAL